MARLTKAELERRVAELEAENNALRSVETSEVDAPDAPLPRPRAWGWSLLSVVLVVIGIVFAPVAVVATWARAELTDTDRFVATFAPLAEDPAVQAFVTTQSVEIIADAIDIPQLTSDVFDGVVSLGTPPRATAALEALKGPAAAAVRSLIESRVGAFVESDAFADVWATALRVTHRQLVATMANDPNSAVSLGTNGEIGVQLAPIIEASKAALVDQGIGFANNIPAIDRTIVVTQSDSIPTVQLAYGAAVAAGTWLPWVSLAFLAAGVLVARRKSVALIGTSVALALVMLVLSIVFAIGRAVFVTSISPGSIPRGVSEVLFDRVTGGMQSTTVAVLTLAIVVAAVGWFAGPFDVPRRLRGLARSAAGGAREFAQDHGVTTGRVGSWVYRQRVLLRAAVAVVASAVIVLTRPLSPTLIVWTLVIALVVVAIIELVQRPPTVDVVEKVVVVEKEELVDEPASVDASI